MSNAAVSFWSSVPVNESRRISSSAVVAAEAVVAPATAAPVVKTAAAPRRLRTVLRVDLTSPSARGGAWVRQKGSLARGSAYNETVDPHLKET
jgi:hypothetical protein